ncbi:MAG: YitT family protein [Bacteroidales bacterium]|nr:YitT family protein [Bacteroidales bacterium]MBD5211666.1 YitT family protein [Bacteroidales bacterium]MBD5213187.1 YitT family protein [Bacteroidales bacterium]MBD5218313.1 YitT family protein [Bacteroidales bacterium]MBD5222198.1 YitT family protein [Bacteroidales bacterium]
MTTIKYDSLMTQAKDYAAILFGLLLYAIGFVAFILPHEVVIGGVAGISTLVYFASGKVIPVAITQYATNLILLAMAFKVVGKTFVMRTIFGATFISIFIGILEGIFRNLDHPLMQETSISVILGGILCGTGVGLIFIHNGSSGGTDIVAAMVSKVSNVSIGRTIIFVDMSIVACSIFLPFEGTFTERLEARVPLMVYGFVVTFIIAYMCDLIINTNRQATQFVIFSHKWQEIASRINAEAHRGVTVMDGMGWYSKQDVKVLMCWCRKIESVTIFRIVKSIDDNAFITQSNVNGVYGKGFDTMRVKMKKQKKQEEALPSPSETAAQ